MQGSWNMMLWGQERQERQVCKVCICDLLVVWRVCVSWVCEYVALMFSWLFSCICTLHAHVSDTTPSSCTILSVHTEWKRNKNAIYYKDVHTHIHTFHEYTRTYLQSLIKFKPNFSHGECCMIGRSLPWHACSQYLHHPWQVSPPHLYSLSLLLSRAVCVQGTMRVKKTNHAW